MPTTPARLHPDLETARDQHEDARRRYTALAGGMTDEQFNFRPGPGRWSFGQNVEHLNLEHRVFNDIVEKAIERGRSRRLLGGGPYRHGRFGNWYVEFLEPPYTVRIPTKARWTPVPTLEPAAVMAGFAAMKDRTAALIERADGLDLGRVKGALPYLPVWNPSLSLGQWFLYSAAHERRHLWQIKHVLEAPGYPASA